MPNSPFHYKLRNFTKYMKELFSTHENRQPKSDTEEKKTRKSPITAITFFLEVQSRLQKSGEGSQAEHTFLEQRQRSKFWEAEMAGDCTAEFPRGGAMQKKPSRTLHEVSAYV